MVNRLILSTLCLTLLSGCDGNERPFFTAKAAIVEPVSCDSLAFSSSSVLRIYVCPADPGRATFKIYVGGHTEFDREWELGVEPNEDIAAECGAQVAAHVLEYLNVYAPPQ